MKYLDFLKKICETQAPSGREKWIYPIIKDGFGKFADITISKLNNIYIHKSGSGTGKIMIMAHSDEVFLIVNRISDKGFIEFKAVGIDPKSLIAQEVLIHGKKDVYGIVALKCSEKSKENNKVTMGNLYIDTGLNCDDVKSIIRVGDYITLYRKMTYLLNENVTCKAIDNRASIAAMYVCIKELENVNTDMDLYFVCSCQEEVGHRGAKMACYDIRPDVGIAIDVTFDGGPMGDRIRENTLKGGPVVCVGPNVHPKLKKRIINTANKYNIPYQIEVEPGNTGTDAWDIQTAVGGIPTLLISIPIKYMHTSVEMVNLEDIKNTGILIAKFIQGLSNSELEGLFCF